MDLVREAQTSRAPIQRVADRVTGRLVPSVLALAALTFIGWAVFGPPPALWLALVHAVTVLMITCPCALGLATPMSIMTGLGRAAQAGILFRNAAALEALASVTTMVLDKTGTVTTGEPAFKACLPTQTGDELRLLREVASLERHSQHPLAGAIRSGARDWGAGDELPVVDFQSETGGGVAGTLADRRVLAGRRDWLTEQGVYGFAPLEQIAADYEHQGATVIWAARDGAVAGLLVTTDGLKPGAADALAALRARGIRLHLLTGDSERGAAPVARALGINTVIAGVRPDGKAEHIAALKRPDEVVAMVGDGINDAPALAAADVGIAIGSANEVAQASGAVGLLRPDLHALVQAIDLSRAVRRNIRQNLFFAFAYNAVMIPIAAGALYPWTGWVLTPMLASMAMSASSISVITNALRLRALKLETPG
jgi:Cu+-exporting ATPase